MKNNTNYKYLYLESNKIENKTLKGLNILTMGEAHRKKTLTLKP
jgi:hypothetical protein